MIDSERRESRIPIPARGNGVTSLPGHPPRFLRVLYEGGEALGARGFRLECLSEGVDRTGEREKRPRGSKGYQRI